ncbi:hypothetical protein [Kaarinaea lacus]
MSKARPKGLLGIPQLQTPDKGAFNTRPKYVDQWLGELPLADTGECGRLIFNTLKEVNQLDIPKKERLYLLSALTAPSLNILRVLKRHYVEHTLPLSAKNKSVAELSIALTAEIAMGYKILIEQSWTSNISILSRRSVAETIHLAIYYLSQMLLTAYQIYIEHPANTWMHIHQLFLFAEENNIHRLLIKHRELHDTLPDCSIRDLYKRIVLLGLISPYRLRQKTMDQLYDLLQEWSRYCRVLPPDQYNEDSHQIKIRLNSDQTPGFFVESDSTNRIHTRVIDTSALVHMLSENILHNSTPGGNAQANGLPEDVLRLVVLTWSGRSKRVFSRNRTNNTLTITLGLSASHQLISEQLRLNPELQLKGYCSSATNAVFDSNISEEHLSQLTEPEMDVPAEFNQPLVLSSVTSKEMSSDVWDPDHASKTIGYDYNIRLWYEQKEKERNKEAYVAEPYNCSNVNESAGGYCLVGQMETANSTAKVQIGELVGIRDTVNSDGNGVEIGVVRRIKNADKGLELGVQKLSPCAEVVAVCKYSLSQLQDKYTRALVLPAIKSINRPVTLLTHTIHKVNDQLIVNKYGYCTHVKLAKLIECTGVYCQFEFAIIKILGFDHELGSDSKTPEELDSMWTLL